MTERRASPETACPNFSNFSLLPWELRTKIWLMTFEPRTIHVLVQKHGDPARPVAVTFQAGVGDLPLRRYWCRHETHTCNRPLCPSLDLAVPQGPVTLQICTESRELALKHYQRYFGGANCCPRDTNFVQLWEKSGFAEPKIWVNFRLDIITMERALDLSYFSSPNISLPDFTAFAPRETKLVQHFAIKTFWRRASPRSEPPTLTLPSSLRDNIEYMARFKSLKELWIVSPISDHEILDEGNIAEAKLQEEINTLMREEHFRAVEWRADMPVVRVESELMHMARVYD